MSHKTYYSQKQFKFGKEAFAAFLHVHGTPSSLEGVIDIETLNQAIKAFNISVEGKEGYPEFTSVAPGTERVGAMNHILAFERFLTLIAENASLSSTEESNLFTQSKELWMGVEKGEVSAQEGMAHLSAYVHQLNKELPEELHYPVPDLTNYITFKGGYA